MIQFPVLRALEVTDYELYPGTGTQPGINARFQPGLTLVIGAIGLGNPSTPSVP